MCALYERVYQNKCIYVTSYDNNYSDKHIQAYKANLNIFEFEEIRFDLQIVPA